MVAAPARLIPPSLQVDAFLVGDDGITLRAVADAPGARCPLCGEPADRVHSRSTRTLADLPWASKGACLVAVAAALHAKATSDDRQPDSPPAASDEVYQGKRRHPRPQLARERVDAEAEIGVARRRATDEQARALHANGATNADIVRTVGISHRTVYRSLHQDPPVRKRRSDYGQRRVITPFEPYLLRRWAEGCRTATVLWREIRAQGFAYSLTNVQRFVNQLRREGPTPSGRLRSTLTQPHGPPPRRVAALLLQRPEKRSDEQRASLRQLRITDPTMATAEDLVADFLVMLRRREGERLPAWLAAAEGSGIDDLARFARTLQTDLPAVQAGLTLRHSNGQTEGQVNRLKRIKRQGYGRAKVDLLRKRVLRAA